MIQINKSLLELNEDGSFKSPELIASIYNIARPILDKREYLYKRYKRTMSVSRDLEANVVVPFERYITNIAAGYAGGKPPRFTVTNEQNVKMKKAATKLFGKTFKNDEYEFKSVIDYINDYNDLPLFFYELIKQYVMVGAAYARVYENDENEIVFAPLSALQTVAIYDYSTPAQKIALFRVWTEYNAFMKVQTVVELTTHDYKKVFVNNAEVNSTFLEREEDYDNLYWKLCPFMACEAPDNKGFFEPVLSLIDAYETVMTNAKHTFEYNDNGGCKLMIVGYAPQNPLMIEQDGKLVQNPDRIEEDRLILEAPTFYTDENGKVEWITKNINDNAVENHKTTLYNNIMQFAAIPDVAAGSFEKTATEVERSFFPLEQFLIEADRIFYKEFIALWENITARINLKKNTSFDFRDIKIEFIRNVPSDKTTTVNNAVLLQQLLSRESLLRILPYEIDVADELSRKPAANEKIVLETKNSAAGRNQNKNQYNGANIETKEQKNLVRTAVNETEKRNQADNERV